TNDRVVRIALLRRRDHEIDLLRDRRTRAAVQGVRGLSGRARDVIEGDRHRSLDGSSGETGRDGGHDVPEALARTHLRAAHFDVGGAEAVHSERDEAGASIILLVELYDDAVTAIHRVAEVLDDGVTRKSVGGLDPAKRLVVHEPAQPDRDGRRE